MPNNFSHFNPIGTKLHNDNIVSLHDLRFFNHITALGASGSVIGGKNLKIVDVPESVTYLPRFSLGFEHSVIVILLARINREKRNSKNYVLFLGETGAESNQAPCLSLVQFQIDDGELVLSAYQRSSDANLGLPADIYHLYLMARQIDLPLKNITLNLGNVHIYENNLERTRLLLEGDESVKFELNV